MEICANEGMTCDWARIAAARRKRDWRAKEKKRVRRERGRKGLWRTRREKRRQPSQKEAREMRARSQRVGWLGGREAAPRERMMVFPGRREGRGGG